MSAPPRTAPDERRLSRVFELKKGPSRSEGVRLVARERPEHGG